MREDYLLVDDTLEIMVFPHKPEEPKWFTYDEIDQLERTLSPRITRMIYVYNDMCSFTELIKRSQDVHSSNRTNEEGEQSEESN